MNKTLFVLPFAAFLYGAANPALAQSVGSGQSANVQIPSVAVLGGAGGTLARAWVSGQGVDAAGCGAIASPCRTIQYAFDNAAAPGGAIYVHDASGYGAQLSITHAISIINDGSGAAVIGGGAGDAIAIQAGATDTVLLKGLTVNGAGVSPIGIHLISGGRSYCREMHDHRSSDNRSNLPLGLRSLDQPGQRIDLFLVFGHAHSQQWAGRILYEPQ
jgi:hypothetical protein